MILTLQQLVHKQGPHLHASLDERIDGIWDSCLHTQSFIVRDVARPLTENNCRNPAQNAHI